MLWDNKAVTPWMILKKLWAFHQTEIAVIQNFESGILDVFWRWAPLTKLPNMTHGPSVLVCACLFLWLPNSDFKSEDVCCIFVYLDPIKRNIQDGSKTKLEINDRTLTSQVKIKKYQDEPISLKQVSIKRSYYIQAINILHT